MRIYIYMISSPTDGKGLLFDEPITAIKFTMQHESMVVEFILWVAQTP
jgi:hypothetical protein